MKSVSTSERIFSFIMPASITILVPWWIHPEWKEGFVLLRVIAGAVGLTGLSLFIYTEFLFRSKGHGTLAPWTPPQKLVIEGPYRYCRNPMITGVLFILIGETAFFYSQGLLVWTILFFLVNTIYFIISEEPGLEERFGAEYQSYKKEVPRWIPFFHF